jgi:HD-GYP domain-containing protein (c-di-GMP phosphodiesterase class II)
METWEYIRERRQVLKDMTHDYHIEQVGRKAIQLGFRLQYPEAEIVRPILGAPCGDLKASHIVTSRSSLIAEIPP